ncbi:hypothetical protein CR513_45809, partial [Mucuna pruriens]
MTHQGSSQSRMVNEIGAVDNLRLENQLTELTSLVRQLAIGQHQPSIAARVYGICTSVEHPTDMCPTLQETEMDYLESVVVVVGKATILTRAESGTMCISAIQTYPKCTSRTSRSLTTDSTISDTTISATATTKNANSRPFTIFRGPDDVDERHNSRPQDANRTVSQYCELVTIGRIQQPTLTDHSKSERECITIASIVAVVKIISATKPDSNEELLRMFQKVEINIPLLDAIKQIPKYANFFKELCVHKRKKMKGSVEVGGIVSALTGNKDFTVGAQALPKKCRDPRIFSIPCTIGDYTFTDAMLDLGASINVMPTSIYKSLNFGDLEPTGMTIQLTNKSVVQPLGILEDVLVLVNELIFPTNFFVLDMEDETLGKGSTLILG